MSTGPLDRSARTKTQTTQYVPKKYHLAGPSSQNFVLGSKTLYFLDRICPYIYQQN
jgi:hypothetical protein